ncbi:hypothetical protein LINGRAHAP2_LOCUS33417 [Linum grandiflorum]
MVERNPVEERFVFFRVEPNELNMFRCIARYGYADVGNQEEEDTFKAMLVQKLEVEKELEVVNQCCREYASGRQV